MDSLRKIKTWKEFWDEWNRLIKLQEYDSLVYLCRHIEYVRLKIRREALKKK